MNLQSLSRLGIFLLLAGGISYASYAYFKAEEGRVPCKEALTYTIGELDPRFGIERSVFEERVKEAVSVWNKEAGREMLRESLDGEVVVSLIYDERQEASSLGNTITNEQATYAQMEKTLEEMMRAFDSAKARHENTIDAYNADVDQYEAEVSKWNSQGGAPEGVYVRLEREQARLKAEERSINAETERLNRIASDINDEVRKINEYAAKTNQKVHTYNDAVGEEFDQGLFTVDERGKNITIYEFKSGDELVRVLAHEFGHALGLDHVENPSSLMYPYNQGTSLLLSDEDKEALAMLCAKS